MNSILKSKTSKDNQIRKSIVKWERKSRKKTAIKSIVICEKKSWEKILKI